MPDTTLTLYYTSVSPPSRTILLLARRLGLKLNLEHLNLLTGENLKKPFVEINPQHSVPCLKDGNFTISESFAIMVYLIETYAQSSQLYPQDPKKKALVHQRVLFVNGTLFPRWAIGYIYAVVLNKNGKGKPDEYVAEKIQDSLLVIDKYLRDNLWFAGDELTIADYSLFTVLTSFKATGIDTDKYEKIDAWMKRCCLEMDGVSELDRPGVQELEAIYNSCKK